MPSPTRSLLRAAPARSMLSALAIGAALTLLPGVASAATSASTTPARATPSTTCHDLYLISVRGSGQPFPGPTSLTGTPETAAIINAVSQEMATRGGKPDTAVVQLRYPAPDTAVLTRKLGQGSIQQREDQFFDVNLPAYLQGEQIGETALLTQLTQIQATCSRDAKTPAVVLVGYSQGALVIHNVLRTIDSTGKTTLAALIAGTALIADPERVQNSAVVNNGTAKDGSGSNGVCVEPGQLGIDFSCYPGSDNEDIPGQFQPTTFGICDTDDIVCDTSTLISNIKAIPSQQPILKFKQALLADIRAAQNVHVNCSHYCGTTETQLGTTIADGLLVSGVGLSPLSVASVSLPDGTVAATYQATLAAVGGAPGYSWTATGLPPGITLSSDGILGGAPTSVGSFTPTFAVLDSVGHTATQTISLNVAAPANSLILTGASGLAGIATTVTNLTCPATPPGMTSWVVTQGANQPGRDYPDALVYPAGGFTYPAVRVRSSTDAIPGVYTAYVYCIQTTSTTNAVGGAVVSTQSFTQTITGAASSLTANYQGTPTGAINPQYQISGGACSPTGQNQGVEFAVYDTDGALPFYQIIGGQTTAVDGSWQPFTVGFQPGVTDSYTLVAYCAPLPTNSPNPVYYYPLLNVPPPPQ